MSKPTQNCNSAYRLLSTLNSVPVNQNMQEVIPPLMGVVTTEPIERQKAVLQFFYELNLLYKEFRKDMEETNLGFEQKKSILAPLSDLGHTIYPAKFNGGIRALLATEINAIGVCATFIGKEEEISVDELESIRKSIVGLRSMVEESDILPLLKRTLLELILQSENAISSYKIHGTKGLRRALKTMVSDVIEVFGAVETKEELDKLKETSYWKAIIKHIRLIDAVTSKYLEYKPYIDQAILYLTCVSTS